MSDEFAPVACRRVSYAEFLQPFQERRRVRVDVRSQQDKMRSVLNHGRARLPPPPDASADAYAGEDGPFRALYIETARATTDSQGGASRENAGTATSGRCDEQSRAEAHTLLPHKPLGRLIQKFAPQVRAILWSALPRFRHQCDFLLVTIVLDFS